MKTKEKKNYTYRSMHEERKYGFYWYDVLWSVLRPFLIGLATLIVTFGIVHNIIGMVYDQYLSPADPDNAEPVAFTVETGSSLSKVSRNLEDSGLIRSKTVFKYYCDFAGLGQKIQSGTYEMTRSMTMTEIADQLTKGDGNPIVRNITMIPGWTIEDLAAKLVADHILEDSTEFLELCRSGNDFSNYYYIQDVLSQRNATQRKYVLEGYLAANTYEIYTTASASDIISKLLSQTEKAFPAAWQDRAEELGFTMDQMLTLASMIEKEAKTADFSKVSAVFHNRLKKNMTLGSDVTIHYITGIRKMALEDKDLSVNSPYNTYRNKGLPIGPICSPSTAAIEAALYPSEEFMREGYYFFCSKDPESGELHFSKTQEEHDLAVLVYAPRWKEFDESRGIE